MKMEMEMEMGDPVMGLLSFLLNLCISAEREREREREREGFF